jgi:dolichyl-phosphate beta-glucosyltransferase
MAFCRAPSKLEPLSVMSVPFSLIIPAYNERRRLPSFLSDVRSYLMQFFGDTYEVIVVDDGSTDGLHEEIEEWRSHWPQLKVIRHTENRGKGAAVRTGMLAAEGDLLLFADADGATPIKEEIRLRQVMDAGADIAVGSRLLKCEETKRKRTWIRGMIGRMFARIASRVLDTPVRDTQCGFKMFRREVGRKLFDLSQEDGYLFDLEILLLASRLEYKVVEVAVNWTDVAGGQLRVSTQWPAVLSAFLRLRRRWREVPSELKPEQPANSKTKTHAADG